MKLKILSALALATAFSFSSASAQSNTPPNAGFETWTNYSVGMLNPIQLTIPNNWHGSDSMVAGFAGLASFAGIQIDPVQQIFETTDAHSGNSAAQIFSKSIGDSIGVQPAALTNAIIDVDFLGLVQGGNFDPSDLFDFVQFKGGEAVNQKVSSASAFLKIGDSSATNKFGFLALALKKQGDTFVIVGRGQEPIDPASLSSSNYTEVTVTLNYDDPNSVPDHLAIVFMSHDLGEMNVMPNNSLKIDDVSYTLGGTGIKIPVMTEDAMLVYPNPASNQIHFNLKSSVSPQDFTLRIVSADGRLIEETRLNKQTNVRDFSNLSRGNYFYQLINDQTKQQQSGQFSLN